MDLVKKIKNLLKRSQINESIEESMKWAESGGNKKLCNELILIQLKYSSIKEKEILGLIRYDDAMREQLQVSNALMELLDNDHELPPSGKQLAKKPVSDTILFLASNSIDTALLQLEKEFVQISRNLQDSKHEFRLVSEWAVTWICWFFY